MANKEKEDEISITVYHLQKNVALLSGKPGVEPLKEDLGYYLLTDHKVADCYRNNKTIEAQGYSIAAPVNAKSLQRSVTELKAKPCGSHCVMFQIIERNKTNYVKLHCTKTEIIIAGVTENEFVMKPKNDGIK